MVQHSRHEVKLRFGVDSKRSAGGLGMAQDRLATVTYRNDPPVCIFADGAAGLERMRRTAEAAGCRIAALTETGNARRFACLPTATALIELDGCADEGGAIALLDWAQREASDGGRRIVASAPSSLLGPVAAPTPSRRVTQLCAASEAERIAAVASASRVSAPRLHDIGREEGPAILQQLTEDVSR